MIKQTLPQHVYAYMPHSKERLFRPCDKIHLENLKVRCWRPRGIRRVSAAARLLGLRVRIPSVAWTSVSCKCCVLSGKGLCDERGIIPSVCECVCVCVCVKV